MAGSGVVTCTVPRTSSQETRDFARKRRPDSAAR